MPSTASMLTADQDLDGRILCTDCNTSVSAERAFLWKRHLKSETHLKNTGQSIKRKSQCEDCGKSFTRDSDRQKHQDKRRCPAVKHPMSMERLNLPLPSSNVNNLPFTSNRRSDAARSGHTRASNDGVGPEVHDASNLVDLESRPTSRVNAGALRSSLRSVTSSRYNDSGVDVSFDAKSRSASDALNDDRSTTDRELLTANGHSRRKVFSHSHQFVLKRKRKVVTVPSTPVRMCASCKSVLKEGQEHDCTPKRTHLGEFQSTACDVCHIQFVNAQDLKIHQIYSKKGYCGFPFVHAQPCQGHHLPELPHRWENMSDNDDFKMQRSLSGWEQLQLRATRAENATFKSRPTHIDTRSVDGVDQESDGSNEHSVKTTATAPCDKGKNKVTDVHGIYQRLRERQHRQVDRMDLFSKDEGDSYRSWLYCGGDGTVSRVRATKESDELDL